MTTVAYPGATGQVGVTDAANFIPELWSDEIVATYKSNLVMPQLVVTLNHVGKKGDTIHIPTPTRDAASAKAENTVINIIANTEGVKNFTISEHWEYSRLIEDIVKVQAIDSLRPFYTDDAGYALATRVDTELHQEGVKLNAYGHQGAGATVEASAYTQGAVIGSDGATNWDPGANSNAGNAAALTDAGIRRVVQSLDDNDVPSARRHLVIPPVEKRKLLGNSRFTEQAFTGETGGGNSIRNGLVGDVYGVDIYVSNNLENATATDNSTDQIAAMLFQRECIVFIEQLRPRVQTQYKQEYLADLFTADLIFDAGVLRPEAGQVIVVDDV